METYLPAWSWATTAPHLALPDNTKNLQLNERLLSTLVQIKTAKPHVAFKKANIQVSTTGDEKLQEMTTLKYAEQFNN